MPYHSWGYSRGNSHPMHSLGQVILVGFVSLSLLLGTFIILKGNFDIRERAAVLYPKYACNTNAKQCIEDETGSYTSFSDCFSACNPNAECTFPGQTRCDADSIILASCSLDGKRSEKVCKNGLCDETKNACPPIPDGCVETDWQDQGCTDAETLDSCELGERIFTRQVCAVYETDETIEKKCEKDASCPKTIPGMHYCPVLGVFQCQNGGVYECQTEAIGIYEVWAWNQAIYFVSNASVRPSCGESCTASCHFLNTLNGQSVCYCPGSVISFDNECSLGTAQCNAHNLSVCTKGYDDRVWAERDMWYQNGYLCDPSMSCGSDCRCPGVENSVFGFPVCRSITFTSADSDGDGTVTTVDLEPWKVNYSVSVPIDTVTNISKGDFDENGKVNMLDYVVWQEAL